MQKQFSFEFNLDDPTDLDDFIKTHGTIKNRALANRLGFSGEGAVAAANALSNYAWNKRTAMNVRMDGRIETALKYEAICDEIYKRDIQPFISSW